MGSLRLQSLGPVAIACGLACLGGCGADDSRGSGPRGSQDGGGAVRTERPDAAPAESTGSGGASRAKRALSITIQVNPTKPNGSKWDIGRDGPPDIYGELGFADGTAVSVPLHKDSFTATASGRARLVQGDRIRVMLQDKDLASDDMIATGFIEYTGGDAIEERVGSATIKIDIGRE